MYLKALTAGYGDPGGDQRGAGHYWNGEEAAHWLAHEQRHVRMPAPFTDHLPAAAAIGGADRVLDLGCDIGSTTKRYLPIDGRVRSL